MKKFAKIIALALVLSLSLLALVACDKSESIKKDFEEAGYEVSVVNTQNEKVKAIFTIMGMSEEEIEEIEEYDLVLCASGAKSALFVKYPSSSELKDEIVDDNSQAYYDELVANGKVRGNCLLIYGILGAEDIFAGK